jgi:Uma2 family endonuclease
MTTLLDEDALVAEAEQEHYAMAGAAHHNLVIRLYEGLLTIFQHRHDACVLAEVTWFLSGGRPMIPDIAVILGAPQTEPDSWRQDRGDPAPTVIIEVVSRSENDEIKLAKLDRFQQAGAGEVWFLHLLTGSHECWRADTAGVLRFVHDDTSALLDGVRFGVGPDGQVVPFFSNGDEFPGHLWVEMARTRRAEQRAEAAEQRAEVAEAELHRLRGLLGEQA